MNESMLEPFLTKAEIIRHGQQYCSNSFTVPLNGTHFTAWSSMNELIRRELVGKMGSPPKYYLTDEGVELAKRLVDVMEKLGPSNISEVVSTEQLQTLNKDIEKDKKEEKENPITDNVSKNNNNEIKNKESGNNNNSNKNTPGSLSDLEKRINDLNQTNLLNEIARNLSILNQNIEKNNLLLKESDKDLPQSLIDTSNILMSETRRSLNQLFCKNTHSVLTSRKNTTTTSSTTTAATTVSNTRNKNNILYQSKLPVATRYLINDDDNFDEDINSGQSRLNVFNEKYKFAQTNGKSMNYLNLKIISNQSELNQSESTVKLKKSTDSYSLLSSKKSTKNTSSKSSVMFKTVTKPFLSKNKKDKGKESMDDLLSFQYLYLNDEDESIYDKDQATAKYGNLTKYIYIYIYIFIIIIY